MLIQNMVHHPIFNQKLTQAQRLSQRDAIGLADTTDRFIPEETLRILPRSIPAIFDAHPLLSPQDGNKLVNVIIIGLSLRRP